MVAGVLERNQRLLQEPGKQELGKQELGREEVAVLPRPVDRLRGKRLELTWNSAASNSGAGRPEVSK
jgi:hypothetical protein